MKNKVVVVTRTDWQVLRSDEWNAGSGKELTGKYIMFDKIDRIFYELEDAIEYVHSVENQTFLPNAEEVRDIRKYIDSDKPMEGFFLCYSEQDIY